jgi:hypothetical protein
VPLLEGLEEKPTRRSEILNYTSCDPLLLLFTTKRRCLLCCDVRTEFLHTVEFRLTSVSKVFNYYYYYYYYYYCYYYYLRIVGNLFNFFLCVCVLSVLYLFYASFV